MSLFRRALPKKRLNAKGNSELTAAQGGINYDADALLSSYSEADTTYVMGHNGRGNPVKVEHRAVSSDFSNFAEDTIVDDADRSRIRVTPEMKNLVAMLANHVEPAGDFTYNEDQMRGLRKFFNDKANTNVANELQKLRSLDMAPTAKQRTRRMELETKVAAMKTAMTRLLRAA